MSEGELKKRIFPPKPDDWNKTHPNLKFVRTINSANNVWKILDEAKQDFPNFLKIENINPDPLKDADFIKDIVIKALEKANKQIEWFEKWFGE